MLGLNWLMGSATDRSSGIFLTFEVEKSVSIIQQSKDEKNRTRDGIDGHATLVAADGL